MLHKAATHPFLARRAPEVVWSGFLSPGYEVTGAEAPEAVLAPAHGQGWGGALADSLFTGLTDARFYGLDHAVPAFYGATSENARAFDERVNVESLRKLTRTVALFVAGWCGVAPTEEDVMTEVLDTRPPILSQDELRREYGPINPLADKKVLDHLDGFCRDFIALSPFLVLASSDAQGRADASPRGDAPGFVAVLDDHTLLIPDRLGNKRVDSFANILASPGVGLIFLVPGINETLRVNGRAAITRDAALLGPLAAQGKVPTVGLLVHVEETFFHCGKALMRSQLWDASRQVERHVFPTLGRIIAEQTAAVTVEAAEKTMEEGYRTRLY